MSNTCSALEAIQLIRKNPRDYALIDVRSEGEFAQGSVPGFKNVPILNNQERHIVGLTYKQEGQERAIATGYELVTSEKQSRVRAWQQIIAESSQRQAIVTCWRGGLRSKIATQWLQEAGSQALRVEGGFKKIRNELLARLDQPLSLIVLSGWTGSGKTKLLQELTIPKVDLEGIAKHRGSSFGQNLFEPQPSQVTFENSILLEIFDFDKKYVLEDESVRIGQVIVPKKIKDIMNESPVVILTAPVEERAQWIFSEYVQRPFVLGKTLEELKTHYLKNLSYIEKHLGNAKYQEIQKLILDSFYSTELKDHQAWIEALLVHHYDKRYQHSFDKLKRSILFQGNYQECKNYFLR